MSLFLNRDELQELSGFHQKGKVATWLANSGYRFEIGADGWPRVLRAAVEAKLLPSRTGRTTPKFEPDFSVYERGKEARERLQRSRANRESRRRQD